MVKFVEEITQETFEFKVLLIIMLQKELLEVCISGGKVKIMNPDWGISSEV